MKRSRISPQPPNNYIIVVLDSCRYDSFVAARPKTMRKLGRVERRWSYASWTAPSHYNLLMGLMPHSSPRRIFSSEYYRQEFLKFNQRLGLEAQRTGEAAPTPTEELRAWVAHHQWTPTYPTYTVG